MRRVSLRLEMLQVARLAPTVLGEAAGSVGAFFEEQFDDAGGARDRAGRPDLYYTVFALEGLIALRREPPAARVRPYLEGFGDGAGLDFVHACCLARAWAALGRPGPRPLAGRIRSEAAPTPYAAFLAHGALEDLGEPPPAPPAGFGDALVGPAAATPTVAAAVTLLHHVGAPVPAAAGPWLLARVHPKGGFAASEGAPLPDLLSTATALHALAALHVPLAPLKEAALDFIDTLWTGRGFCGSWADDAVDAEYTYYALLALGHLSLA
jgi:hypothetical protein